MKLNVSFTRVYQFSSAHRLHSPFLSAEGNRTVYDKCNNPNGHGHDYRVEVTVSGIPDRQTGMIIPLPELDQLAQRVLEQLDYKHLNNEVEFFRTNHSTGEVIIQYLWDELNEQIPDGKLYHIKLWETNNNYFEIGKD